MERGILSIRPLLLQTSNFFFTLFLGVPFSPGIAFQGAFGLQKEKGNPVLRMEIPVEI